MFATLKNGFNPDELISQTLGEFLYDHGGVHVVDYEITDERSDVSDYIITAVFSYDGKEDPDEWVWDVIAVDLDSDDGEDVEVLVVTEVDASVIQERTPA
jgi:hypothetical protein